MNSLALTTDPDKFALLQRMANAFARSDLVPEHMRHKDGQDGVANCTVALLIADQMGENPLVLMQNLFFINGRAGFLTQYMIARAAASHVFMGPLRWLVKVEGKTANANDAGQLRNSDNVSVTCYADLGAAPPDDQRVEVTVDLTTAIESKWTSYFDRREQKHKTHARWATLGMQTQMLRWRSAAWLIRLYAPHVMMGFQTGEELADLAEMKDVTPPPPPPRIDDYKPGVSKEPAEQNLEPQVSPVSTSRTEPEEPQLGARETNTTAKVEGRARKRPGSVPVSDPSPAVTVEYKVTYLNGLAETFIDPDEAAQAMRGLLNEARGSAALSDVWARNGDFLAQLARAQARDLSDHYYHLMMAIAGPSDGSAGEAKEQAQDTHGSKALDEDAAKLAAMGVDPGPTLQDYPERDPWWDTPELKLWDGTPPTVRRGRNRTEYVDWPEVAYLLIEKMQQCPSAEDMARLCQIHIRNIQGVKLHAPDDYARVNEASQRF